MSLYTLKATPTLSLLDSRDNALYFLTNLNAPNKKLIKIDATAPTSDKWTDVIPETANVLDVSKGAGFLFANYMVDAISQIKQYDYEGKLVRDVALPGLGTVSGFGGKTKDTHLVLQLH